MVQSCILSNFGHLLLESHAVLSSLVNEG